MRTIAAIAMAGLIGAWATGSQAAAAPAGVLNKTITIQFTSSGVAKDAMGATRQFNTTITRMIYVSSQGRLFMRFSSKSGSRSGATRGGDAAPGEDSGGSFAFRGDRLVGVIPWASGARQVTISFDPSFSSCSATTIEGRSAGNIRRRAPNGEMVEIVSSTASAPTCSIQSGNAFAN